MYRLYRKVYNSEQIENIPDSEIQFTINDQLFLEVLLMELRGQSMSYASFKHKERNKVEQTLIENIRSIENNLEDNKIENLENLKTQLNDIRHEKLKGHVIRSRAKHIDQGEKPTKYFCGLEQHNYISKTISKIEKEDGSLVTDQKEILKETESFYKCLYSKKNNESEYIELDSYIDSDAVTKLTNVESEKLEGLLSLAEISETLLKMKNDKSPGLSGFSAEFLKVFWKHLGQFVLRSINYGYAIGKLSESQRQGIITYIPKENKPKQFLKNWRPLTLLDTVYKIASGTIANRLKQVLDNIISRDQTGFLKGRFIGENTRLVYDMLQYTEQNNITGLLMLIDFEKAFDSLSWSFIHKALKFLNFGESVRRWVEVFYSDITSSVIQNGHLSSFFQIGRGCRQGDPLSPYIFIICAEFLANKIRLNKDIKGIKIGNSEHKISQYADDTSIFLDGSDNSLNELLKELDFFAAISGLKVNFDKTQLVWIGAKKFDTSSIKTKWKLLWGKQTFKLLGINFNTDLTKMTKENYMPKIQTLEKQIKQWEKRRLTPLGKITAIKVLMIPAFNHLFITLPNPEQDIIDNINEKLFRFLWNNKVKIKRNVVIKQYLEGGLKMVNLNAFIDALKLTWIRRIFNTDSKWQDFIKLHIECQKLIGCSAQYIKKRIDNIKNTFWVDVLNSFLKFNDKLKITDEESVIKCPIFHNKHIQIDGNTIFYDSWYRNGVRFVNDLLKENGEFYNIQEFSEIYGIKMNYLQYWGTLNAIKTYLRKEKIALTKKSPNPFIPSHILPIKQNKQGARKMYDILNTNDEIPTGKQSWNKKYNFEEKDWKTIYMFPFKTTTYSLLRWFQVSLNYNILVTNKLLHYMKIKEDSICTFCTQEEETITHLLWQCNVTKVFLNFVTTWLQSFNIYIELSEELFLFGLEKEQRLTSIMKFLLLYTKYYIYCCRCNKQPPVVTVYKKRLHFMYKIHLQIARENNNLETFLEEWNPYQLLLNDINSISVN